MTTTQTTYIERATYGQIQAGDSIGTFNDRNAPSRYSGNGGSWQGTVTNVERDGDRVKVTVEVGTRSLCADDLVHGFHGTTYVCNGLADQYLQRRVRDQRTGRRFWSGLHAEGWSGEGTERERDLPAPADTHDDIAF